MGEQEQKEFLTFSEKQELGFVLHGHDYGWTEPLSSRKYFLTNPADALKVELIQYASAFRGSGHSEWEYLWGFFLKKASSETESGNRADISVVFNRDWLATRDRRFTMEQTWNHLKKWFTIEEETDDEVVLTLNT